MNMDPKMAEALAMYWPDLFSAYKQQQQAVGTEAKTTTTTGQPETLTNDEMEDLNDEVSSLVAQPIDTVANSCIVCS